MRQILERLDQLEATLEGDVARVRRDLGAQIRAVHRDVLSLRAELAGVIDPRFPAVGAG